MNAAESVNPASPAVPPPSAPSRTASQSTSLRAVQAQRGLLAVTAIVFRPPPALTESPRGSTVNTQGAASCVMPTC